MTNHMFDALKKDKEIISNCTLEEYRNSSLTKTPTVYGHYKSFENGFYTVKEHPNVDVSKVLMYPKIHKASELFTDIVVLQDGVGNDNQATRPSGYLFICDDSMNPDAAITKIKDTIPKLKAFKVAYVKPAFEHASYEDTGGWFVGCRSYELMTRHNPVTSKDEWLVIGIDRTGISNHWLAVINEWDLKPNEI